MRIETHVSRAGAMLAEARRLAGEGSLGAAADRAIEAGRIARSGEAAATAIAAHLRRVGAEADATLESIRARAGGRPGAAQQDSAPLPAHVRDHGGGL